MNKFTVKWSSTHWFEVTIDLDEPPFEGLSREDLRCDTQDLSQETLTMLQVLAVTRATVLQIDGTEISQVTSVHDPVMSARERQDRQAELRRTYPYIYAHGALMGSNGSYVWNEAEQANHDGAPRDAVHRDEWEHIDRRGGQAAVLESEKAGAAFVVRDENGGACRVWYLISDLPEREWRERHELFANRIAAGESPWIEKTEER